MYRIMTDDVNWALLSYININDVKDCDMEHEGGEEDT